MQASAQNAARTQPLLLSSDFLVTVNTQQPATQELGRRLMSAVNALRTPSVTQEVLGEHVRLRSVDISAVGVEISERAGLLHAHFVMELLHSTPNFSIGPRNDPQQKGINRRLQEYFTERINTGAGVYVAADLLTDRSAAKNYNRKQQRGGVDEEGRLGLLLEDLTIDG